MTGQQMCLISLQKGRYNVPDCWTVSPSYISDLIAMEHPLPVKVGICKENAAHDPTLSVSVPRCIDF